MFYIINQMIEETFTNNISILKQVIAVKAIYKYNNNQFNNHHQDNNKD